MPTNGAEVIYSSGLTIRDAKEMATLCVFYDKVYLPHTTREGSRKYYALEGASGIELVGFENVSPAGHRHFVEDVNIWDDAYRPLGAEGVVERLPPFDWQVPDVARMLTELAVGHPSLAAELFLNAPPARFSIAGVELRIMKQDLALHFLRPDLGAAQLFSGAEKRPSRELMVAFEAKVVFSYLLPALAELSAGQILEVREKVKDTREGFAMHLQKLSKGVSDRLKGGESPGEITNWARDVLETELIPDYREFRRQLAAERSGFWGKVLDAAAKGFAVDAAPWTPKFYGEMLKAFGLTALTYQAERKERLSNRSQAFQFMRSVETSFE